MIFSVAWRPHDENEEADALTNEVFTSFDPGLRVPLQWDKLEFLVLPHSFRIGRSSLQGASRIEGERQKSVPRVAGCKSPAEERTAQRNGSVVVCPSEGERSRPRVVGDCSDCCLHKEKMTYSTLISSLSLHSSVLGF